MMVQDNSIAHASDNGTSRGVCRSPLNGPFSGPIDGADKDWCMWVIVRAPPLRGSTMSAGQRAGLPRSYAPVPPSPPQALRQKPAADDAGRFCRGAENYNLDTRSQKTGV